MSSPSKFQYRKRYGLHAIKLSRIAGWKFLVSIPQAVWIACNASQKFLPSSDRRSFNTASGMDCMQFDVSKPYPLSRLGFNTASGMDCMQWGNLFFVTMNLPVSIPQAVWIACNKWEIWMFVCHLLSFNTASGMDCMQYRPSQPLGQLNPEAGFLNGSLFLANRRNLAGFFCRQNRLKTSANPVIPRKLLSTGKI